MNKEVNEIIRVMKLKYDRDISMYDEYFLVKTLGKRWGVNGIKTAAEYCKYLETSSMEADDLSSSLNINYSEFFRSSLTFALLEHWIVPKLISQKARGGEIRVWSAG